MHNAKRLLCEFKLRRDRPLSGKAKIPHFQPQYVSQGARTLSIKIEGGSGGGAVPKFTLTKKTGRRTLDVYVLTLVSVVI